MKHLRKEDILLVNEMTVEKHGGKFVPPFNILNEDPLDYLVDAIKSSIFGQPLY